MSEMPINWLEPIMETRTPEVMEMIAAEVTQASTEKKWGVMTGKERWTYTWHVAVMLCTFGLVYPNAVIS
jgi:hypothetical protein